MNRAMRAWFARERERTRTYLFILIGGDGDEFRLFEDERSKRAPAQVDDRVRARDVEARLILMHGIQDRLQRESHESARARASRRERTKPCLSEMLLVSLSL